MIVNPGTGFTRESATNDRGAYSFPSLVPGTYNVTVRRDGFAPIEVKNVVLNVGDQKSLQIQLKAGDVNATVQVTNEAELIRTDAAVGTVVDRRFVGNLPLNGRSFQSLLTLTPGVLTVPTQGAGSVSQFSQFSVNGQRASSNAFMVDGVSANIGAVPGATNAAFAAGDVPGLTAFGTTQSLVSVDALEEFKVQTSSYAAEYGRQPGGQISIVTRSGGNQFHGSLFEYLRNDKVDANDWFANRAGQPKPPERQNDFGGTFSGPVLLPRFGEGGHQPGYNGRNRTFFFFSYEGLRLRLPNFNLTNVPTLALRQTAPVGLRPILNSFPIPNGRDLGNGFAEFTASYSNPSTLNATSIRLDHTINDKWTLFGRYNNAPSETASKFADRNLSSVNFGNTDTQTVTLGATAAFTPRMANELKVNYSYYRGVTRVVQDTFGGATELLLSYLVPDQYISSGASQGGVLFILPGLSVPSPNTPQVDATAGNGTRQHQLNFVDNFSYGRSSHQFKFGVDYRRLTPVLAINTYFLIVRYTSLSGVLSNTNTTSLTNNVPAKPVYVNFSAYGQDTWKLSRRLTLTLGLRWELNPPPRDADGNDPLAATSIRNLSTMQLAPPGSPLWKTTYNNFAPRIGLAYRLRQTQGRETVVRGGFGVFYDTGNDSGTSQFFRFPFASSRSLTNVSFPLSPTQVAPARLPVSVVPPFPAIILSDPSLMLPYTLQWNVALEQSLGQSQAVTVSYVGAAGRRLLQSNQLSLATINPSFTTVTLMTNNATSDYHALQAQFTRRLSRGLQALLSYTWAHAIDDDSASNSNRLAKRGNSAFDVRHNFAGAVSYDIPALGKASVLEGILGHWSSDFTLHVQSALPLDLIASTLIDPPTGSTVNVRPNVIAGIPLYLYGSQYPGGRTINDAVPTASQIASAGCAPLGPAKGRFCTPPAGRSGTLGRNVVRGLPAWQVDLALRRQISLTEKLKLQFRAEAFNLFNHPNFGAIQTTLTAANFGQATGMLNRQLSGLNTLYQIGGPRSFQFTLKLGF